MTQITGRESIIAFVKAAAWRTAIAGGADDGQFILSDGLVSGHAFEILNDESLALAWVQNADTGLETIAGDISAYLRYQGQELLLALAMGDPQAKAGVGPYTEDILLETTLRGLYGTYAILMESGIVAEVPSVKVTGFDLSADYGNPVEAAWHLIGNRLLQTGDAGIVNTPATMATVTIDDDSKINRVIFDDNSDFLINDESGGALAAPGDRLGIASFGFSFNRGTDNFAVVNNTDLGIEEPVGSDFPIPTLTITLPEFDATNSVDYKAIFRTGVTKKAKLTFAKGTDFEFNMWFPRLRVTEDAPAVTGPARIPNEITFECLMAEAVPTGFTDTLPFMIDTKNNVALAPF